MPFLPYGRHLIEDDDVDAVVAVLKSATLTSGPVGEAFEAALAEKTGAAHAVSCSSGTAALHLAALALGLGPGDVVVVPTITFLATANAARYVGADVIFADVDADSGLMGPEQLERALEQGGKAIKAVFPVHLGGQSPDMAGLATVARKHNLAIIEDASHAIGSTYARADDSGDVVVGECADSDMAVFSFHPVKTVAMGEGGAVTTNDPALRERLRLFRNHGMSRNSGTFVHKDMAFENKGGGSDGNGEPNPWYYEMQEMGFNYRASDIHCALGLSQLAKLEKFTQRRRALAQRYDDLLAPLAPMLHPVTRMPGGRAAWHLYQVLIDFGSVGLSRAGLMHQLNDQGIGTQVHYIPVHCQPYYAQQLGQQILPGAERFYERCLSLPLFPAMDEADVERVVDALAEIIGGAK